MTLGTLVSFDALIRDHYPLPGERIKQHVVDSRRDAEWERKTCPRFAVPAHDDNCGDACRNSSTLTTWLDLWEHDCCGDCNGLAEQHQGDPEVVAWRAERAARPPIEADRAKLSDEIAPEWLPMPRLPLRGRR